MELSSAFLSIYFIESVSPINTHQTYHRQEDSYTDTGTSLHIKGIELRCLRPRITGSVGIDLAYTAAGIFGGAVSFSPNIWDNAAGIFLCQAAGATVTDLYGNPWDHTSRGAIVGTARAHETILTTLTTIRTGGH